MMRIKQSLSLKSAKELAGSISDRNSKMPGSTFALSAKRCNVGSKLVKVKGSVCDRCYALKIQKLRPSVDKGWESNYMKATTLIETNPDVWVDACAFQIKRSAAKSGEMFHRWFDSGDLPSVAFLSAICKVAKETPNISHWLPTRESKVVKDYMNQGGVVPANLIIRISSTMIGDTPVRSHSHTSTVHRKGEEPSGHICPAPKQGGNCGQCRACWSFEVPNISYALH